MSLPLAFHKIELRTASGVTVYEFNYGLNVVTGDYSTGKSSMFEMMKFAMGSRNAHIMPDIAENLRSVTLELTIGSERLQLIRMMGSNRVAVAGRTGLGEVWTTTQGKLPRASIRLLEILGFPVTRLGRRSGTASEPITFFDLFRYVYLPQAEVNSAVVGHSNTFLNRKRVAIFELAYGLADDRVRDLELAASDLMRLRDVAKSSSVAVRRFLTDAGTPEKPDLITQEASARSAFEEAELRLVNAREMGRGAFGDDQGGLRKRIGSLRSEAADLEAERLSLEIASEKGRALIAQLELDEESTVRAQSAVTSLTGLEFAVCPRCLQSLQDRTLPDGHCLLCTQQQMEVVFDADTDAVLNRLRSQRVEATELVVEDEQRLRSVIHSLARVRADLNDAAAELELQAEPDRLLPSIDMSTEAAAARELARAKLRDIERDRDLWAQYDEIRAEIDRIEDSLAENVRQVTEHKATLEEHKDRVHDLSVLFDDEIRALGFAGYESAKVDAVSFLPVINGHEFDQLSVSGARKTLANVSYYLANLALALSNDEILLPSSIILDSPRTSLGNTPSDSVAGARVYWRMHLLSIAYPKCQIIVADNGLPKMDKNVRQGIMKETNIIELTYPKPLLADIAHPGRDKVNTVDSVRS